MVLIQVNLEPCIDKKLKVWCIENQYKTKAEAVSHIVEIAFSDGWV
jgi:hypothetical protein